MGMYEIMLIVWGVVFVTFLVLELSTTDLFAIWFSLGALIALVFAAIKPIPWFISIFVYIISSLLLFIFVGRYIKKKMKPGDETITNVETYVGKQYRLLDDITLDNSGTIKIDGVEWSCVSYDNKEIKKDTIVTIKKIEGNKFIVSK